MAEIEMDIDMIPAAKFDEPADEDLIDYDIDTTQDHNQTLWLPHHDEHPADSAPDHLYATEFVAADASMDESATYARESQKAEVDELQDEEVHDYNGVDMDESDQPRLPTFSESGQNDFFDMERTEDTEGMNEGDGVGSITSVGVQDELNEIDYDDGDILAELVSPGAQKEAEDDVHDVHDVELNYPLGVAEDISEITQEKSASAASLAPESIDSTKLVSEGDEDEITWEHDDKDDATTPDGTESHHEAGGEAEAAVTPGNNVQEESSGPEPTQNADAPDRIQEHADFVDFDRVDTLAGVLQQEDSPVFQEKESQSQSEHSHVDREFPAITVHYKGDEFPFFTQEESEGFFSNHSILDQNLESVLAGFRAELENEIVAKDELVFQIDELGLEFAESTMQGSLTSITLRQILEIFDLLVKNQDPGNTRTLYTYLFTKPSTSKRFEFLVESAAAGKGLDEVIHLFTSPVSQQPNIEIVNEERVEENAEVDDSVNSIDDKNVDADADNEGLEQQDEGEENEAKEQLIDNIEYHDESPIDMNEHVDQNETEDQYEEAMDEAHEDDEKPQPPVAEPVVESDQHTTVEANSPNATDSYEHTESDANPFIHLEFDEFVEANEREVEHEQSEYEEIEYEEMLRNASSQPDDERANHSTADSSTTATLADNGETISALADANTEHSLDSEASEEDQADQDELREIDWRDDPNSTSGIGNDPPVTPSGVTKRPRDKDERSVEDEQDVKRRRS